MELRTIIAPFVALTLSLACAAEAAAGPPKVVLGRMTIGYTYYNRVGASVEAHDTDVKACIAEARKLTFADEARLMTPTSIGQGVLGDALGNALNADVGIHGHYGAVAAGVENCMVVRGWRVVLLGENQGIALSGLDQATLAAKLAPWIGAENPQGKVVRTFGNDAAFGATQRLVSWPKSLDSFELSLKSATGSSFTDFRPTPYGIVTPYGDPVVAYQINAQPPRLLEPGEVRAGLASPGIIIVSTANFGAKSGPSLIFQPEGDAGRPGLAIDARLMRKRGTFAAFAVRPGRWRIAGFGPLNFCFGAPAFDVAAGEVVYAGAFDFDAPDLGPNLSLDPAKAWLGANPAASSLKPASYVNGTLAACGGHTLYALEVKGAPFVDGYQWGSAVNAPPASATAAASPPSN